MASSLKAVRRDKGLACNYLSTGGHVVVQQRHVVVTTSYSKTNSHVVSLPIGHEPEVVAAAPAYLYKGGGYSCTSASYFYPNRNRFTSLTSLRKDLKQSDPKRKTLLILRLNHLH